MTMCKVTGGVALPDGFARADCSVVFRGVERRTAKVGPGGVTVTLAPGAYVVALVTRVGGVRRSRKLGEITVPEIETARLDDLLAGRDPQPPEVPIDE